MKKPTQKEIFATIKKIMEQKELLSQKHIKDIETTDNLSDFLDSLDYVELIIELENKYVIAIPDEECNDQVTFQDLIDDVKRRFK